MRFFGYGMILLLSLMSGSLFAKEIPIPALTQRVTDLTDTITNSESAQISNQIVNFENKTGHQLAVLVVKTTGEETIEQYATRVFEQWKLGDKKRDDGLLLLIAKQDHTLRLEVGYGLEGEMTDVDAANVLDRYIVPLFKKNQFAQGISSGIERVTFKLTSEKTADGSASEGVSAATTPNRTNTTASKARRTISHMPSSPYGVYVWIVGMLLLLKLNARSSKVILPALWGGIGMGIGNVVYQSVCLLLKPTPFKLSSLEPTFSIFFGIFMFIVFLILPFLKGWSSVQSSRQRNGWESERSSSSSSTFGGGGGSSGGGGASSRW